MREFGLIHSRYWQWAQENKLSDSEIIIGAYLLSNRHGNSLGCYYLPIEYAACDLGYTIDTISIGYKNLIDKKFIRYCEKSKYIFIRKYLKWNKIQNKKHSLGVLKIINQIPSNFGHISNLLDALNKYGNDYFKDDDIKAICKNLSIPYPYPNDTVSKDSIEPKNPIDRVSIY